MLLNILNTLTLIYSLEAGYLPNNEWMFWDYNSEKLHYEVSDQIFFTDLDAYLQLNMDQHKLMIGGDVRTNICFNEGNNFTPTKTGYNFEIKYTYKNIDIKFKHYCTHPIKPYVTYPNKLNYHFEGGYQELSIKFNGINKLLK